MNCFFLGKYVWVVFNKAWVVWVAWVAPTKKKKRKRKRKKSVCVKGSVRVRENVRLVCE